MCDEHKGKELLDKIINLSVEAIYECIFTFSEFNKKYWKERKYSNIEMGEWNEDKRLFQFDMDLGAFGTAKSTEEQVLKY